MRIRRGIVLPAFFFIFVYGSGLFFAPRAEAAFGISPPFLGSDNLIPGTRYVQTIYLVQDQPTEDLAIDANLDIHDRIRSWFTIHNGNEIVIPKGTRQFPVEIVIQVPKDAQLGAYKGALTFVGKPARTGQVTIALGAEVTINLTVGTGIYRKVTVQLIRMLDIEEGWSPRVYVKFNNEGNVPEALDGATFDLYDQYGAVRLAYIPSPKGKMPETPPFTVKEYVVEFPLDLHLGLGQYWGSVNFSQEGKVIASQRTVFNVLKRGSLSTPFEKFMQSFQNQLAYYVIGAIIVIVGGTFVVRRRRRL